MNQLVNLFSSIAFRQSNIAALVANVDAEFKCKRKDHHADKASQLLQFILSSVKKKKRLRACVRA